MSPQPLTYSTDTPPVLAAVARRNWRYAATYLCVAAVAVGYVLAFTVGRGRRGFYSPDTLEYRTQSEALLPLTRLPLYRSSYRYHQPALFRYLVAQGLWAPREAPEPRWFHAFHWNNQWKDGTAPLHKELSWRGGSWVTWSQEHPDTAAVMWPLVLDILRADEPEWDATPRAWWLMNKARASHDAADFQSYLASAEGRSLLARTGN